MENPSPSPRDSQFVQPSLFAIPYSLRTILSHASSTGRRVRYTPHFLISFSISTRKVSPGKSGPYTSCGTTLNDRNVAHRIFEPSLKTAGLRRIRFHDLRHTCASLPIHQGESPKYIQGQMRHASVEITFDRYGHLFPDANREATRRLDATLFG